MNRMRESLIGRFLNCFAMLAFLLLQVPVTALADPTTGDGQSKPGFFSSLGNSARSVVDKLSGQSGTKVTHEAIKYFVPAKRIRLDVAVADPKGVKIVRAYFKGKTQADYVFVPMEALKTSKDSYVAILPAMAKSNTELEYLFLVVNGANEVLKTEPFLAKAKDSNEVPTWQMVNGDESIKLFTEIADAPSVAASFSDSVSLNVVESGARFGLVAKLYGGSRSDSRSGAAASATNAGTAAVATAGVSMTTIGIAAAVVVGGVASRGSGGGGSAAAAPPAICSAVISSQTQRGSQTRVLDFGNVPFPINFTLSMTPQSAPDRFRIQHDGQEIYSSGFISDAFTAYNGWSVTYIGSSSITSPQLTLRGGSTQITVIVDQPLAGGVVGSSTGSAWDYTVNCN